MRLISAIALVVGVAFLTILTQVCSADEIEIRGPTVEITNNVTYSWGPKDFPGFYHETDYKEDQSIITDEFSGPLDYDYDTYSGEYFESQNYGTERINFTITNNEFRGTLGGIIYKTEAQLHSFKFKGWRDDYCGYGEGGYFVIGFLGEPYFAAYNEGSHLYDDSTDESLMRDEQLSKVMIDEACDISLTPGESLVLAEGYELKVKDIVQKEHCWNCIYLELLKDGISVDTGIVEPFKESAIVMDCAYTYETDMDQTEDIVIIAVHFKPKYPERDPTSVIVDGIWQISDMPTSIEESVTYGKMAIQLTDYDRMYLVMENGGNKIELSKNGDIYLMGDIWIRIADQEFYIYRK